MITAEHVREGAVVIDVGINRVQDVALATRLVGDDAKRLATLAEKGYALVGDVDFPAVAPKTLGDHAGPRRRRPAHRRDAPRQHPDLRPPALRHPDRGQRRSRRRELTDAMPAVPGRADRRSRERQVDRRAAPRRSRLPGRRRRPGRGRALPPGGAGTRARRRALRPRTTSRPTAASTRPGSRI